MMADSAEGPLFASLEDARIVWRSAPRKTAAFQAAVAYMIQHIPQPTHVSEDGQRLWDVPTMARQFGVSEAEFEAEAEAHGVLLRIPCHRVM